ncbi:pseudouridine-5'-phosphate glycosidase [Amycolatopsis acidiphila]|uniref:Pseudouridine-5'-phosphate glycosidase n=1 Tax=Amycolatopsis acidiphila TaxID=715473 RepID=A0A558AF22_9PSEU|nr:pseudouridine-5'-phosphate glycosidase [Amycolatopsis acidiphila]TVT22866.1 pseudouridine-5'-phosphate glycosidase [Amycolatopsis acidiphila]UIJ58121.1 pseudouridine-5'-phosphate glycosidase [Amycolatopsis acidiphila]GHG69937.1 pseudouridine-5'-phosphate glycosidase [Amycolatopsis acidiphila]
MTQISLSGEVADAVNSGRAIVALESTILSHGLPPGRNLDVARRLEETVRAAGAVPATIAVLDGTPVVGLSAAQLDRVCAPDADLDKLSLRDLGPAIGLGRSGATTVASTSALAHEAGIGVFATGGLGGVHVGANESWDISADLGVLARVRTLVVCSGVKSVLDIAATLEVLETNSVPVLGYRTDDFPAFYLRSSRFAVPWRVEDPAQAAAVVAAHRRYSGSGALLANPIPVESEMDGALHDRLLAEGLDLLRSKDVRGKDVTPVLLEHFHTASGGVSLDANEALVLSNAKLAAEIAVELA